MKVSDSPIILNFTFATTEINIWNAITNKEEMIQWFFENIDSFEAEIGSQSKFKVHVDDKTFTHLWEVTEVVPGQRIRYNWKYAEYPGNSYVTFEIGKEEQNVTLKLTMDIIEEFPDSIPEFRKESCIQGWEYFLGLRLKEYLGNKID